MYYFHQNAYDIKNTISVNMGSWAAVTVVLPVTTSQNLPVCQSFGQPTCLNSAVSIK